MTEIQEIEGAAAEEQATLPPEQAQAQPEQLVQPEEIERPSLRDFRALVPVGKYGAKPTTLAQQVDLAQTMAKGVHGIPAHLKNNPADCLAIIQMADAVGLHPFLLAQKAYVQNGRLAFESQAFHAMLRESGRLAGALRAKWEGDGDEMTCTVWGTLKGESEPHYHTSEPLRKLHPGHITKDGRQFVRGSPLWDKKPKVQIFYDTVRDWTRMWCPESCLGMYVEEEFEETPIGPERAIDVSPGLGARLRASPRRPDEEGHRDGYAHSELDKIAPNATGQIKPADVQPVSSEAGAVNPPDVQRVSRRKHARVAEKPSVDAGAAPTPEREIGGGGVPEAGRADPAAVRDMRGEAGPDASPGLQQAAADQVAVPKASSDAPETSHVKQPGVQFRVDADATVLKAKPTWQSYREEWLKRIEQTTDPEITRVWIRERDKRSELDMPTSVIAEMRELVEAKAAKLPKKKKP